MLHGVTPLLMIKHYYECTFVQQVLINLNKSLTLSSIPITVSATIPESGRKVWEGHRLLLHVILFYFFRVL